MSADKRIVEKLDGLIYHLERLDIWLDNPASDMTLGEYEDKRKEIIESCAKSIEEMLGAGTCKGEIDTDYFECKLTTFKCHSCGWSGIVDNGYAGYSFGDTDMPRHCPNCGRRIEVSE